jgi:hypothetical protein
MTKPIVAFRNFANARKAPVFLSWLAVLTHMSTAREVEGLSKVSLRFCVQKQASVVSLQELFC